MTRPLAVLCALVLAAPAAIATARADEDCGDLGRNYQLIEREAVSVQTNMALISAADRGCEALARQLLDAGASLLARDRHGDMALAHAAMSRAAPRSTPPPMRKSLRPWRCCWRKAPTRTSPAAPG